jgi:hypothetical protein
MITFDKIDADKMISDIIALHSILPASRYIL